MVTLLNSCRLTVRSASSFRFEIWEFLSESVNFSWLKFDLAIWSVNSSLPALKRDDRIRRPNQTEADNGTCCNSFGNVCTVSLPIDRINRLGSLSQAACGVTFRWRMSSEYYESLWNMIKSCRIWWTLSLSYDNTMRYHQIQWGAMIILCNSNGNRLNVTHCYSMLPTEQIYADSALQSKSFRTLSESSRPYSTYTGTVWSVAGGLLMHESSSRNFHKKLADEKLSPKEFQRRNLKNKLL